MMMTLASGPILLLLAALTASVECFSTTNWVGRTQSAGLTTTENVPRADTKLRMKLSSGEVFDRRSILTIIPAAVASVALSPNVALADDKKKVVVVGGSGWLGAHVDKLLLEKGCDVVSVARSSPDEQKSKIQTNLGGSLATNGGSISYVSLDALSDDLTSTFQGASAVVSCVGVAPGSKNMRDGNGKVNVRIADAAKAAGVSKLVYVSVASEIANGPAKFLFGDYVKGKQEAEAGITKDFGSSDSLILKPGIVDGAPPGEIRPPGPPGMTPIPVNTLAKAAVAGALGNLVGVIDGSDAIVTASK